jgi:hypothetical protein
MADILSAEEQAETIMREIFELAESLCPGHPNWLPDDVQHRLSIIEHQLRHALGINMPLPYPATVDQPSV